jgi:peptidoglycan/xylan/chitin deacetylase (PgdA/CDA1 family)
MTWRALTASLFVPLLLSPQGPDFTLDHGAIIRGDRSRKQIALVFTGGDFGEGTAPILNTLHAMHVPAGLFVTGGFLKDAVRRNLIARAVREGHYVGPHSDQHLLYCDWNDRDRSLVTEEQFRSDLQRNIDELKYLGALKSQPVYFIPPYEWFNADQVRWAAAMGVAMFNYTPGLGSQRDYLPEADKRFVASARILDDILRFDRVHSDGLNGAILLLHLGADRQDKMFSLLPQLIRELRLRGYEFVRVDRLLAAATSGPRTTGINDSGVILMFKAPKQGY